MKSSAVICLLFSLLTITCAGLIGDICTSDPDCAASFSTCVEGKCVCQSGFEQKWKNSCSSKTKSCPHVGVVTNPQACVTMPDAQDLKNGSCPADSYCFGYGKTDKGEGHCCPKPQLLCPVGLPDPLKLCGDHKLNRCDSNTHFCHGISLGTYKRDATVEVCCKKPCVDEDVYHQGKCYPTRSFGQSCEINQQCSVKGSVCKSGVCGCPTGETYHFNTQFFTEFCSKSTSMTAPVPEIPKENGKIRIILNGNCSFTANGFCSVAFSQCINGACQCASGFTPDSNTTCTPTARSCPYVSNVKTFDCTVTEDPIQISGSIGYMDTCLKGYLFCLTHTGKNVGSGHCCPVEPLFCPTGTPDKSFNSGKCDIVANLRQCKNEAQMCISTFLNEQRFADSCCPVPCQKGQILKFGSCQPEV